jgi:hypothetical protein
LKSIRETTSSIQMRTLEYRMHLLNIALARNVVLSPSASLRIMSEEEICISYPFDEARHGRSCFTRSDWINHKVEAVIKHSCADAELPQRCALEAIDNLEKCFTHAHLLCCFDNHTRVYSVCRRVLVNDIERQVSLSQLHSYTINPKILDEQSLDLFSRCFSLLCCDRRDRLLDRSIDKFLSGRKRDIQHPNTVNTPNWDKIMDYVVAMEAILLSGNRSELTLRFKLNGAWLLSEAHAIDRNTAFVALGHLYSLRSSVVHGYDLVNAKKSAQKFLGSLSSSNSEEMNDLDLVTKVSRTIEIWMQSLFLHLIDIPKQDRPYNCEGAWDNMYLGKR